MYYYGSQYKKIFCQIFFIISYHMFTGGLENTVKDPDFVLDEAMFQDDEIDDWENDADIHQDSCQVLFPGQQTLRLIV